MKALLKYGGLALLLGATACVDVEDQPSRVQDFRVLGVATEPPELMASACEITTQTLDELSEEVTYRTLLVDPKGEGRPIQYTLWACADTEDRRCENTANRVLLSEGSTVAGELAINVRPGASTLAEDVPLLQRVQELDPYRGLGGLRMPLVLRVQAGDEVVYAQKLMVFWCPAVEGMQVNVQPRIPGLRVDDVAWPEDAPLELRGPGPFVVTSEDVTALQETYVVPGLRLEAVTLRESWEMSWHTTLGEFAPQETGGSTFGGQEGRHRTEWEPPSGAEAQEVTFWVVVRDGRGGSSWVVRRALWSP